MSAPPPPDVADGAPPSRGRVIRRLVALLLVACAVLALAAVVMIETPFGVRAVATLALRIVRPFPGFTAEVGGARGGALTGLELHGIRFRNARGAVVIAVDTLRLEYRIPELLGRPFTMRGITASGLFVDAPALPRGKPSGKPPFEARLGRLAVARASLRIAMPGAPADSVLELRDLFARVHEVHTGRDPTLVLDTLGVSARIPGVPAVGGAPIAARFDARAELLPGLTRIASLRFRSEASDVRITGAVPTHPESSLAGLDLTLEGSSIGGRDLARGVPQITSTAGLALLGHTRSDGARTTFDLTARAPDGGSAAIEGVFDTPRGGPLAARAGARIRSFDLASLLGGPTGTRVVEAKLDAEVSGRALGQLDGPVTLSLAGSRFGDTRLDEAALQARFQTGRANFDARARLDETALTASGWVRPFDPRPSGDLRARVDVPAIYLGDDATPVLYRGGAALTVSFQGVSDTSRTGTARVTLDPAHEPRMLLTGGTAEIGWRASDLHARTALAVADGTVETDATVTLNREIAYRVPALRARNLWLGAWEAAKPAPRGATHAGAARGVHRATPDTLRLDADLALTGRGFEPATMRLDAEATRLDLRRGSDTLVRAKANATLDRRALTLDANAALDTGTVALHGTATIPGGDASVTPATLEAHAQVVLRDARYQGRRLAGQSTLDLVQGRAHGEGSIETDAGRGTWSASARPFDPAPVFEIERFAFTGVDPGVWARHPEWRARLDGHLEATVHGTDPDTLAADLRFDLAGSRFGPATFDRLDGRLHTARGIWDANLVGHSGVGTATVDANGRLTSDSLRATSRGRIEITRLGALVGRDSLAGVATAGFEANGVVPIPGGFTGAVADLRLDGRARLGDVRLDTLRVAARLRDSVLTVTRLEITGVPLAARGGGTLPLLHAGPAHPGEFRLDVTGDHLSRLGPVLGVPSLSCGPLEAHLETRGPSDAREVRLSATALRAGMNHASADSIAVTGSAHLDEDHLLRGECRAFAGTLITGDLLPRSVTGSLVWDGQALETSARSQVDPQRYVDVGGRLWPNERRARLERLEARQLNTGLTLAHPTDIEYADGLQVHDLVLLSDGQPKIRLDGGLDSTGRIDARGTIESLAIDGPMQFVGLTALGGTLDAKFEAGGTIETPSAKGELQLALTADRKPLLTAAGHSRWSDGRLVADLGVQEHRAGSLTTSVDLPLVMSATRDSSGSRHPALGEGPVQGALTFDGFDLAPFGRLVSPRVLRRLSGVLDGEAKLSGTAETPQTSGSITLDKAGVELPQLGTSFKDGAAELVLEGRTVKLDRFALRSGGGSLEATGKAELQRHAPATFAVDTRLDRFRVMDSPTARIAATGTVSVTGTRLAPRVNGELTLEDGVVWAAGSSEQKFDAVELTEDDLRELRTRFDLGLEKSVATNRNDILTLDMGVKIGSNLWLRTRSDPVLALELGGDFRAHKEPGQPLRIAGSARVVPGRSSVSFLGRRFEVTQANVALPGDVKDAKAKVEARYDGSDTRGGSDVEVTAFVTADANGTVIDLRSRPHLERDEILRFITTGQAPGTTGAAGGDDVAGLAAGWLLGTVGGAAGQRIGIDVVQVTQDAYGGHTMSAGSYVHPRVYLGIREPINAQESSANGPGNTTLKTEYDIGLEAMSKLLIQVQGNDQQTRIFLRPRLGH
jgi:TamB, inner membrane protein subunit of TAM complex